MKKHLLLLFTSYVIGSQQTYYFPVEEMYYEELENYEIELIVCSLSPSSVTITPTDSSDTDAATPSNCTLVKTINISGNPTLWDQFKLICQTPI